MAKASILRQLTDADLDALHHKLRRDAETDAALWSWARGRLGDAAAGISDAAGAMVIGRYRKGEAFTAWLKRWENQDATLKRDIELQRQRFEYLKDIVQDTDGTGLYRASKHLQARLLTLASAATDEELMSGDVKFLKGLLKEVREAEAMERKTQVERLKDELKRLMAGGDKGERPSDEQVVAAVDKIMGLA